MGQVNVSCSVVVETTRQTRCDLSLELFGYGRVSCMSVTDELPLHDSAKLK